MERRLKETAQAGDINALYELIGENPIILKNIDEIPFVDTPLHIAASFGHTHFAMEIATLWPSFGKKLNPKGLTAVHKAVQNRHTETVKRLISIDSELIRVRGKDRTTPLHCAAKMGNVDLLAEFLDACPESIEDLNITCESVVHVAVRNRKLASFNVLLGWIMRNGRQDVLNWKDEQGNTVLHIAASSNQPQVVRLLVKKMNKNDKNLVGLTALDRAVGGETLGILRHAGARTGVSVPNRKTRAEILSRKVGILNTWWSIYVSSKRDLSSETRNAVLVVAVLIATATYTAVLNPPGGIWQQDTTLNATLNANATTDLLSKTPPPKPTVEAAMRHQDLHHFFLVNTLAFGYSIITILFVLRAGPEFLVLYVSLIFLFISYWISLKIITPTRSNRR